MGVKSLKSNSEYILNFTIPKGNTGANSFDALVYIFYNIQTSNNILSWSQIKKVPKNTNVFNTSNNISIEQTGYYSFTISGCLKETGNSNPILKLQLGTNNTIEDLITISLSSTQQLYFSQTKIKNCKEDTLVQVFLQKNNDSDASIQNANLIIKKLCL